MEGSRITKHLNVTDKFSLLSPNSRNKKLFLTCRSVGRLRGNKINNATMLPWQVTGNVKVGNPTRNCNRNWWDWSRDYENRTGKPKDGWVYVRSPNIYQNWVISTNVINHIVHNRSVIWWNNKELEMKLREKILYMSIWCCVSSSRDSFKLFGY